MKHVEQVRGLQNLKNKRRKLAKLQIATFGAKHAKDANQCSQPAAIHISDVGELQNDIPRHVGQLFQLELKKTDFVAADDAAAASNDDDVSSVLGLQSQLHGGVKPITFRERQSGDEVSKRGQASAPGTDASHNPWAGL